MCHYMRRFQTHTPVVVLACVRPSVLCCVIQAVEQEAYEAFLAEEAQKLVHCLLRVSGPVNYHFRDKNTGGG